MHLLTSAVSAPPYGVEEPWFSMIDREKLPARIQAPDDWEGKPSLLKGIYERQKLQGWTENRWNELRATYYGMCARVDHQFGMVMDALREAGMYEDTAVFSSRIMVILRAITDWWRRLRILLRMSCQRYPSLSSRQSMWMCSQELVMHSSS